MRSSTRCRPWSEAFPVEGRRLQRELGEAAEQRPDGDAHDRFQAERRHQRDDSECARNRDHVEHGRRERRNEVVPQRVEHAHERRREGNERQGRQHDARQLNRERELAWCGLEACGREQTHQRVREDDTQEHQDTSDHDERVHQMVAQPPGGRLARTCQVIGEGRYEGSAHRTLGEQIPEQIGYANRDVVGVHGRARAEERGEDRIATQSQHATGHGGRAGRCGRSREP
jgi:hypothetical protein